MVILGVVAVYVLWNGFYTVAPHEQAIVLRFGKYHATQGPGLHFMVPLVDQAVPVDTSGGSFQGGTPRQLVTGAFAGGVEGVQIDQYVFADYDVAADGSRFLMFPAPQGTADESRRLITLVTNWFKELKQRATPR